MIKKKYFYWTVAIILLFSSGYITWAAVSGETLINVQNPDYSVTAGSRVKDAGSITDNQTTGILPSGLMGHDGTNWDKVKSRNGIIFVNLTGGGKVTQSGTWFSNITGINGSVRARQSGTWFSNITGVNGSVRARQSGTWNVRQNNYTTLNTRAIAPRTVLNSLFTNQSSTGTGATIELYNLVSAHTWQVVPTKITADVKIKVQIDGSIDNSNFYSMDTYSSNISEMRHIAYKPVLYSRARAVTMVYTGVRPKINVKSIHGGN